MNDVIKIKKPNQVSNVKVSHEASSFYADLSKQWAIKLDKPIENGEYSSKYYAKISEQNADSANKSAKSAEEAASNLNKFITNSLYFPELKINNEDVISNKLKLQKHSTFDKSKFTVVGNPMITNDGVASGFSTSNYLSFNLINEQYNKFVLDFVLTTGDIDNLTTEQDVISNGIGGYGFLFKIGASKYFQFGYNDGVKAETITSSSNVKSFTKYRIIYEIQGQTHKFSYTDLDSGFTYNSELLVSTEIHPLKGLFGIGHRLESAYVFTGSIDLKQFSITVDGKEVFNGNKTGIDVIKADNYTVVGSPVISDDGVASGFSSGNYLQAAINNGSATTTIYATGRFTIGTETATESYWSSIVAFGNAMLQLYYNYSNNNYDFRLFDKVNISYTYNINILPGTGEYEYEITSTIGQTSPVIKYRKTTSATWTLAKLAGLNYTQWDKSFKSATTARIGYSYETSSAHNNITQDLNAFKIYVDGDLVYQPCLKIPYTQSKTGSKIVDDVYRERVQDMYEQCGYTHYYTLGDEDYTLATCKGSDVVESGDNYEQTADLTLKQWGSATSGQTVNLLPYKDTNYAVTLANGSKTKSSFVANATGDYFAVGKTVLG